MKSYINSFLQTFLFSDRDLVAEFVLWYRTYGSSYVISAAVHMIGLITLGFIGFSLQKPAATIVYEAEIDTAMNDAPLGHFDIGDAPLDPTELNTETLMDLEPAAQTAKYFDESPVFEDEGGGKQVEPTDNVLAGLGGLNIPTVRGAGGLGGLGPGEGDGTQQGSGGAGEGFGARGAGHREALLGSQGGTKASERAVAGALNWLYRHQSAGGNWSLQDYTHRCKGRTCSSPGSVRSDTAATALALLPFLAAGQTHQSKGPYKASIKKGVTWLIKQQTRDGNLAGTGNQSMYAHGLATIALCEAYGMTKDKALAGPAQKALLYIEDAQNESTGGWRYKPGDLGDTSVVGWQVMALKSGQMASLAVNSTTLEKASKFLDSVAVGRHKGRFAYQPGEDDRTTMTSVGLLCRQYLGASRDAPAMLDGRDHLMSNVPDAAFVRDIYCWYYGTQVMHNLGGPEWDQWNRQTRRILIQTQCKTDCEAGSWDPEQPSIDSWGTYGGRVMMTSLSALTLEVYYRYLPLYKFDQRKLPSEPVSGDAARKSRTDQALLP